MADEVRPGDLRPKNLALLHLVGRQSTRSRLVTVVVQPPPPRWLRSQTTAREQRIHPMATQKLPFTTSLPDAFNTLIGLIMVRWGYLELRLQQLVFMTLRVSEPQGRLAVKNLRAMEMVELAVDLMLLEGVRLEVEGLSQLKEIESRRNLLAHGVWHHDAAGGTYILRDLTGAWRSEEKGGAKVKRKILPAGVPITIHNLQDLASAVEGAVRNAEEVGRVIQEQRANRAAAPGQS